MTKYENSEIAELENSMIEQRDLLLPNEKILAVLEAAYHPCSNFGICPQAKFDPRTGHIPRGFLGATGKLSDVKVVFLFAEPGHPHDGEIYSDISGVELLKSGLGHVYNCFKNSRDQFHANTRWVMNQIWPNLTFDQQLKHVWLTEGRLCSITNEIGYFNDTICGKRFLIAQLNLLSRATVIAFGGKAERRLAQIRGDISNFTISAYSLSPPGANHKPAKPSWLKAVEFVKEQS